MRNLTVISEVFIDVKDMKTLNRSVNEILNSYSRHFDKVHYIGPAKQEINFERSSFNNNVLISTIREYDKTLKNRVGYYLKYKRIKSRYEYLLNASNSDIVQIRIPSLFTIAAYPVVKSLNLPLTTYIAGDWIKSFSANYNINGSRFIAKRLDRLQHPLIRNSIPVTAGPILAEKYSMLNQCHAYYSTTHNKVYNKNIIKKPQNIIYVGRLEPLKRVEDAIKGIGLLLEDNINVKLTILGDGVMLSQLKNLVQEMKIEDYVLFKGNISEKKRMEDEYLKADILLLPSLSEGTPKVLAEAMAHSVVPIAVKGVGSNDYIIQNGINGILVPEQSPESIANSIRKLVESKDTFSNMIYHSKRYAAEHTLDNEVDKLWNFVFNNMKKGVYK